MKEREKDNAYLFLEFMVNNGFNPNHHYNILELIQDVPNSMSKYLIDYPQFLLSDRVEYLDLEEYGVRGARGTLTASGISVPKSLEADAYFERNTPKLPYQVHGYFCPSISEIDAMVSYLDLTKEESLDMKDIRQLKVMAMMGGRREKYLGFISKFKAGDDMYDVYERALYEIFIQEMESVSNDEYELLHDTISEQEKEFYLIMKK